MKTTRAGTIRQLISYKFISNFFSNNNGHIFRIKVAKKSSLQLLKSEHLLIFSVECGDKFNFFGFLTITHLNI